MKIFRFIKDSRGSVVVWLPYFVGIGILIAMLILHHSGVYEWWISVPLSDPKSFIGRFHYD